MNDRTRFRSLALLSAGMGLLLAPPSAQAEYLVNQQPIGGNPFTTYVQEYTDTGVPDPTYSLYIFDDFTVKANGWLIDKVTAYGIDGDFRINPNINYGVVLGIGTKPDIYSVTRYSGTEISAGPPHIGNNLVFTFQKPLYLAPGTYWLTPFVQRNSLYSGWFFRQHTPVSGSEAYYQNPSGDFTYGNPNAIPFSQSQFGVPGNPVDLAFSIEGNAVPEPGVLCAFTAGLLVTGCSILRRRHRH